MLFCYVGVVVFLIITAAIGMSAEEERFALNNEEIISDKDIIQACSSGVLILSVANVVMFLFVGPWEVPFLCIELLLFIFYARTLYNCFIGIKSGNTLYLCNRVMDVSGNAYGCGKLIRRYQLALYEAGHQQIRCPHCENDTLDKLQYFEHVTEPQKWMDSVLDAPKADRKSMIMVNKSIKKMKKYHEENRLGKMFEDYQSLKPSMDWVKNIDSFSENKQNLKRKKSKSWNEKK